MCSLGDEGKRNNSETRFAQILFLKHIKFSEPIDNDTPKKCELFTVRKSRDPHKTIMYIVHHVHCVSVPAQGLIFILCADLMQSGQFGE